MDYFDRDLRELVNETEQRLPADVRQALKAVRVVREPAQAGPWATADASTIYVHRLPYTTEAGVALVGHEAAHILRQHVHRVAAGQITAQQAEAEAEQLVARWLPRELRARQMIVGR